MSNNKYMESMISDEFISPIQNSTYTKVEFSTTENTFTLKVYTANSVFTLVREDIKAEDDEETEEKIDIDSSEEEHQSLEVVEEEDNNGEIEEEISSKKRKFRLSDENILDIIKLYQDKTIPIEEISDTYNISRSTIYSIINEYNIQQRGKNGKKIGEETRERVLDLYQTPLSIKEIAEKCGISFPSVRRIVQEAGIKRPAARVKRIGGETREMVLDLYQNSSLTMNEIAEKCDISKRSAQFIVQEAGITKRGPLNKQLTDDLKPKILELYKIYGLRISDIARRLNLTPNRVGEFIRKEVGLDQSRSHKKTGNVFLDSSTFVRKQMIAECKERGMSTAEIADKFGVCKASIYQYQ